jgi:hypothetical protein
MVDIECLFAQAWHLWLKGMVGQTEFYPHFPSRMLPSSRRTGCVAPDAMVPLTNTQDLFDPDAMIL